MCQCNKINFFQYPDTAISPTTQSKPKQDKGKKLVFTSEPPDPSDQVIQSCSVRMPTGEYVYLAEKADTILR